MVATRSGKPLAGQPNANPYPELKSLADVNVRLKQLELSAADRKRVEGAQRFRAKVIRDYSKLEKDASTKARRTQLKKERDAKLVELDKLSQRSEEHDKLLAYRLATYGSDSDLDSSDDGADVIESTEGEQQAGQTDEDVEAIALQHGLGFVAPGTARRPAKAAPRPPPRQANRPSPAGDALPVIPRDAAPRRTAPSFAAAAAAAAADNIPTARLVQAGAPGMQRAPFGPSSSALPGLGNPVHGAPGLGPFAQILSTHEEMGEAAAGNPFISSLLHAHGVKNLATSASAFNKYAQHQIGSGYATAQQLLAQAGAATSPVAKAELAQQAARSLQAVVQAQMVAEDIKDVGAVFGHGVAVQLLGSRQPETRSIALGVAKMPRKARRSLARYLGLAGKEARRSSDSGSESDGGRRSSQRRRGTERRAAVDSDSECSEPEQQPGRGDGGGRACFICRATDHLVADCPSLEGLGGAERAGRIRMARQAAGPRA